MSDNNQLQFCFAIANNNCSFIGFVNGFPVFINVKGYAYNLSVPINPYIFSGENNYSVLISPSPGTDFISGVSECKVEVIVKANNELPADFRTIAMAEFPVGSANEELKIPFLKLDGKFEAKLPFKNYSWADAKKLDKNKDNVVKPLVNQYKEIHALFSYKNENKIAELIQMREHEFANAYYENFETGFTATRNVIAETLTDPYFELQPFNPEKFIISFAGDGRIAFMHDKDYNQPICFINQIKKTRREFPFYFMQNEEGEFIVIR